MVLVCRVSAWFLLHVYVLVICMNVVIVMHCCTGCHLLVARVTCVLLSSILHLGRTLNKIQ